MAAHEYDPDDNFGHAFNAQDGIGEDDTLEVVAWQFLLLVNPDDEDAALHQFRAFQQGLAARGEDAETADLLLDAIDWQAGFRVADDDSQGVMEVLDEIASRWRLRIDWGLDDEDDDAAALTEPTALLRAAFPQLRERHYSLWTLETGEDTLAGWITREADEEAMLLVVSALGLQARIGVG